MSRSVDADEILQHLEKQRTFAVVDCKRNSAYGKGMRDAMKIIEEAPTVEAEPQWTSVKDGLPEKLTLVLVCNHGIYDIAFVGDRGNWVNKLFEPEYWMPLPEPPKEVSK